jgi:NADPH-dependent 2,4-dienoyl-CoA reductase/sulfur reductase-like enzyme
VTRRRALRALAGIGCGAAALAAAPAVLGAAKARVVVVGAGWAGLSLAHALSRLAPQADVQVIDRHAQWLPLPLSSPWLVGLTPQRLPRLDLAELARRQGWRFAAAPVTAIDRSQRAVHTSQGRFDYDWLVLATGADYDDSAWFGGDAQARSLGRERFAPGFMAGELDALRQRLQAFRGGTLVMTVPPAPYRCPPAPYERAVLLASSLRQRGVSARLVIVDAGGGMPRFNRLFAERWGGWIENRLHSTVRRVDPFARTLTTDEGDLRFEEALLLPPMYAGGLVQAADLLGQDAQGRPTRWAAVDAATLRSARDERVVVVGDMIDAVSPLFGAYPKTAHIAADLGAAAATHLAAAIQGQTAAPPPLPTSQCHVWLNADPPEQLVLETSYRHRGDGLIVQTVRQHDNPQPRDEDLRWARSLLAERLGVPVP